MQMVKQSSLEIALARAIDGIFEEIGLIDKADIPGNDETGLTIEFELAEFLKSKWDKHTLKALTRLMDYFERGQGKVTQTEFDGAIKILEEELGPGFLDGNEEKVYSLIAQAYMFGRERAAKRLKVQPTFSLADSHAQSALQEHSMYWIRTYYDRELRDSISEIVRTYAFEQGLGRMDVARELQRALVTKPFAQGYNYWDVLASAVIQRSRSIGVIRTFEQAEITRYKWLAMMDERTCPICSRLDGKVFEVESASKIVTKLISAKDPESVKETTPWLPGDKDTLKWIEASTGEALAAKGVVMPPVHGRCRCTLVAETEEILRPKE